MLSYNHCHLIDRENMHSNCNFSSAPKCSKLIQIKVSRSSTASQQLHCILNNWKRIHSVSKTSVTTSLPSSAISWSWSVSRYCLRHVECSRLDAGSVIARWKDYVVTNFFKIKPTRCTNFTNLFWHETLHVSDSSSVQHHEFIHCTLSNGICHTGLETAFERDQDGTHEFHPGPARKLSSNLYDIYHCWVYSE